MGGNPPIYGDDLGMVQMALGGYHSNSWLGHWVLADGTQVLK